MRQKFIVETRDGRPVRTLIDLGDGEERLIFVTEAAKVFSNDRRQLVRLEIHAELIEREAP